MTKFLKIFSLSLVVLIFCGLLGLGLYRKQQQAIAQDFSGETQVICEEPIPVGLAIDATIDLLDKVYQTYKGESITGAKNRMTELVTVINEKGEGNVCNFNECRANIKPAGGDLIVQAKPVPLVNVKKDFDVGTNIPPICVSMGDPSGNPKDCVGNPCPSVSQFITRVEGPYQTDANRAGKESLEDLKNRLNIQADNIHLLFEGKNKIVPEELAKAGEKAGETAISDSEYVLRYTAYLNDFWFTPSPGGCIPSELQRKRIDQGLMGEMYPLSCLSALAKGMYSPKPWSETCTAECADNNLSNECRACLAECEGKSVYASLNCKIYSTGNESAETQKCSKCESPECDATKCTSGNWGSDCAWGEHAPYEGDVCYQKMKVSGQNDKCSTIKGQSKQCCGNECAGGVNSECYECLCEGLTQEQCLDWVCGGSKSNWVCCREEPIQNPKWYAYDQEFSTVQEVDVSFSQTGETIVNFSQKQISAPEAYQLAKDVNGAVPEVSIAFLMATIFKESSFRSDVGNCNVDTAGLNENAKNAFYRIMSDLHIVNNDTIKRLNLTCGGGAMGAAQFIPTTWDIYKNKAKEITGAEFANPWNMRDSFVAAAVMLKAKMGWPSSEKKASIAYYGENGFSVFKALCFRDEFQKFIDAGCYNEATRNKSQCENSDMRNGKVCNLSACKKVKEEYNDCKTPK